MRNLKRALSLALASVMVLGLMVVGSSAKGYDDVTSEENVEAIEVLQAVGIMTGDDNGNFNPTQNVTRNEMAVIMSNLMDFRVATYKGTSPFTDVPEWAEPYVAACYTNGIIAGYSSTTFGGSDPVVTSQATLMVLKALGYFQYQSDFGDDWQLATINQANKVDLLVDVDSAVRVPMTRNDVAQLVLNGLETGMVEADDSNKINVSVGGAEVSVGGTNYVYVTSREKYAKSIKDKVAVDYGATSTAALNAPIVELGEKLYQGDLIKKASEDGNTDDFGRPANRWTYQAQEIGAYAEEVEQGLEFTAKVTPKKLYNAVGKTAAEKYAWTIYENGVPILSEGDENYSRNGYRALVSNQTNDSDEFWKKLGGGYDLTGNGVLSQIYVDGTREEVTLAVTYFYPAEIYRVNSSDGKIVLNSLEGTDDDGRDWGPASTNDEFEAEGYEEDEIVYYTFANNKIQSVARADRIEGEVTKVVANTSDSNGSNFDLDGGENYKYNLTMKSNKLTTENVDNNMAGYVDANGYVVYIDRAAVTYDYAYVLSIGTDDDKADDSGDNSTVWARLLLTDGSMITVETDVKAANRGGYLNHIVSYSKNGSNVYTLALKDVDNSSGTPNTTGYNAGTVRGTDGAKQTNAGVNLDIFENGKSPVNSQIRGEASYIANSNTVFLTVDTNGSNTFSDWSFSTYTGIKNIPDIKTQDNTWICVAANENRVAKVVYVQNADVSGTGDAIFVLANGGNDLTLNSGSTKYYELKAFINGEETTIRVKKDSNADEDLIQNAVINFGPDGDYEDVAVNTTGKKYIVPIRTMSVDNDGLVTSVHIHDAYDLANERTNGSKALSGVKTGRDRTTGNEIIYLDQARSWVEGAKLVQYSVKNDAWTDNIKVTTTSVKDDSNDEWVAIFDDGEVVGLFIKDVPAGEEETNPTTPTGDDTKVIGNITVNVPKSWGAKNINAAMVGGQIFVSFDTANIDSATTTATLTSKGFDLNDSSNGALSGGKFNYASTTTTYSANEDYVVTVGASGINWNVAWKGITPADDATTTKTLSGSGAALTIKADADSMAAYNDKVSFNFTVEGIELGSSSTAVAGSGATSFDKTAGTGTVENANISDLTGASGLQLLNNAKATGPVTVTIRNMVDASARVPVNFSLASGSEKYASLSADTTSVAVDDTKVEASANTGIKINLKAPASKVSVVFKTAGQSDTTAADKTNNDSLIGANITINKAERGKPVAIEVVVTPVEYTKDVVIKGAAGGILTFTAADGKVKTSGTIATGLATAADYQVTVAGATSDPVVLTTDGNGDLKTSAVTDIVLPTSVLENAADLSVTIRRMVRMTKDGGTAVDIPMGVEYTDTAKPTGANGTGFKYTVAGGKTGYVKYGDPIPAEDITGDVTLTKDHVKVTISVTANGWALATGQSADIPVAITATTGAIQFSITSATNNDTNVTAVIAALTTASSNSLSNNGSTVGSGTAVVKLTATNGITADDTVTLSDIATTT